MEEKGHARNFKEAQHTHSKRKEKLRNNLGEEKCRKIYVHGAFFYKRKRKEATVTSLLLHFPATLTYHCTHQKHCNPSMRNTAWLIPPRQYRQWERRELPPR